MPKVSGRPRHRRIRAAAGLSRTRRVRRTRRPTPAGTRTPRCGGKSIRPMSGRTWLKYHRYSVRTPGVAGIANSRIAMRPPGASTRRISSHAARRVLDVADAEPDRDGVDGAVVERDARRVAAHESDPIVHAAAPDLVAARRAASPARNRRRRRAAAGGRASMAAIARSAVPVHRSSTRSRPVSDSAWIARLRQRRSMPALSRWLRRSYRAGNRIEHARDARWGFGEIGQSSSVTGQVQPDTTRSGLTMTDQTT